MRSRATIKWAGLALAGLLIAVGVAIAAGNLASRQIGLASEPISAGDALAPAASGSGNRHHPPPPSNRHHGPGTTVPTTPSSPSTTAPKPEPTTPTAPTPEPTAPTSPSNGAGDDHGGGGQGADD